MAEQIIVRNQAIGRDRQTVTQYDQFLASEFVSDRISGANNYTSGFALLAVVTSNVGRIRPMNIHFHNSETAAMTVLFRDGSITGTIVCGPYILNPTQGRPVTEDQLRGRSFVSGIYPVVISGTFTDGIEIQVGYIIEAEDYFE